MNTPFLKNCHFLLLITFLISSCAGKKASESSDNILENLTFSIDTVSVDVGEELFMAEGYYGFDLSLDQSKVYFFYDPDKEVHEIDLKTLTLKSRNKFEQDGPNGVPSFVSDFQAFSDGSFYMGDFMGGGFYSISGEKLNPVSLNKSDYKGLEELSVDFISNSIQFSSDKKTFLSLPVEFGKSIEGVSIADSEQGSAKFYSIPAMDITNQFQVTFQQQNSSSSYGDFIQLSRANDLFFLTSNSTSDTYVFDVKGDSLRLLEFSHQLVPKKKTGTYTTVVDSREKQLETAKAISQEISFLDFHWDESRKKYFRFGKMNQEYTEEGRPKSADIFLFVYDENLELLGEKRLEGIPEISYFNFFREGKFYGYHIKDEVPGFVVLDFEF